MRITRGGRTNAIAAIIAALTPLIIFLITNGEKPRYVPEVVGKQRAVAISLIKAEDLRVRRIDVLPVLPPGMAPRTVVSVSPAEHTGVRVDDPVDLVITPKRLRPDTILTIGGNHD